MTNINRISSILTVNIVIVLILFILIEGLFRILNIPYDVKYIPNENTFSRFDPELGWSYLPDKSAIHKTGNITRTVHFDRDGIRVTSPDFQFDYSKPSILFIGGSFTMGHGMSYEESFVGKFEALDEIPYQVVNLGVQGYGSDQALLSLKKFLIKFNTKIVVYTFITDHIRRNGNYDRRMLVPTARFLGTKPKNSLDDENKIYLSHKPLLYKDYINSYLLDFIKMRLGKKLGTFPPFPEDLTKAIILEMKNYSNSHGAHFILLNWRWTENDYNRMFKNMDINVIDTLEEAPTGWETMVLFHGIHPTEQAGKHVVNLLLTHLKSNKLI